MRRPQIPLNQELSRAPRPVRTVPSPAGTRRATLSNNALWAKHGSTSSTCSKTSATPTPASSKRRSSPRLPPTRSIPARHASAFRPRRRGDADGCGRRAWDAAAGPGAISQCRGQHEIAWRGHRVRRRRHQARAARGRRGGDRDSPRRDPRRDGWHLATRYRAPWKWIPPPGSHRGTRHGRAASPDQSALAAARRRISGGGHPRPLRAAARSGVRRVDAAALSARDRVRSGRPAACARDDPVARTRDHSHPSRPQAASVCDCDDRAARRFAASKTTGKASPSVRSAR